MAFKFISFLAWVAAAQAGLLPAYQVYHQTDAVHQHTPAYAAAPVVHQAPVAYAHAPLTVAHHHAPVAVAHHAPVVHHHAQPVLAKHDDEYDPHPQYKFGYDVQDAVSGDTKSQVEERDGDDVHGEYSLIDADGFKRTVKYTSDPVNGFNAVVSRVPLDHAHVKTASVATYAAPAATYVKEYPTHTIHHH